MPDGLLDSLTQAEAIHLLRFITEMGKIDGTFRPHPGVPNHTFLRTKFAITRAGDVVLDFGSAPKGSISLWADGKPVPVEGKTVKLPMSQGDHWVFVGFNRDIIGEESVSISIDPILTTAKQ